MSNDVSKFPSTMDAKVWASRCTAWFGSFKVPDLNDWFQAALARGYNEGRRKSDKEIAELRESNLSATRHASEQTALAEIAFADAKRWGELYFAKVVNDGGKSPTSEHAETKDALAKLIRDPAPEAPSPLDPENIMGRAAEGLRDQAPKSPGPEKIEPRWRATKHGAAALDSLLGTIPPEMFEAAEKLGAWAASRGLDDWELGPVRCRFPKLPPSPQPSDPEPKAPGTSAPMSREETCKFVNANFDLLRKPLEDMSRRFGDLESKTKWSADSRVVEGRMESLDKRLRAIEAEMPRIAYLDESLDGICDSVRPLGDLLSKVSSRVGQLWQKQAHEMKNANQRIGKIEEKLASATEDLR